MAITNALVRSNLLLIDSNNELEIRLIHCLILYQVAGQTAQKLVVRLISNLMLN